MFYPDYEEDAVFHDAEDAVFLAMANWQLGNKDEALKWYKHVSEFSRENTSQYDELDRMLSEAAALMRLPTPQQKDTLQL